MTVSASEVAASDSRIARRACAELQATATASRPMSDLGLVDPTSVPVPERQVTDEASPHRHHRRLRDSRGRRPRGRRSHAEHLARARTGKTDARQTKSRRRRPSRWPMSRPAFCRSWSPASCATGWLGRRSSWSPLTRASLPEHDHRRTHLALAASHSTRRRSRRSSVAPGFFGGAQNPRPGAPLRLHRGLAGEVAEKRVVQGGGGRRPPRY